MGTELKVMQKIGQIHLQPSLSLLEFVTWAEYFLIWREKDYVQKGHSWDAL